MRNKSLASETCDSDALCGIIIRFQMLSPTQGQVAHALLTRPPLIPPKGSPFDLNVLCTPPAFILSQDQTLEQFVLIRFPFPEKRTNLIRAIYLSFFYFFRVVFLSV